MSAEPLFTLPPSARMVIKLSHNRSVDRRKVHVEYEAKMRKVREEIVDVQVEEKWEDELASTRDLPVPSKCRYRSDPQLPRALVHSLHYH